MLRKIWSCRPSTSTDVLVILPSLNNLDKMIQLKPFTIPLDSLRVIELALNIIEAFFKAIETFSKAIESFFVVLFQGIHLPFHLLFQSIYLLIDLLFQSIY